MAKAFCFFVSVTFWKWSCVVCQFHVVREGGDQKSTSNSNNSNRRPKKKQTCGGVVE